VPERRRRFWTREDGAVAREAGLLSLGTQLEAALSFVTIVVLVRSTSTSTAGRVFFALALSGVIFLVLDPRLEDTLQRYAPQLSHRGHDGAAASLFRRCLVLDVFIAAASAVLVLLVLVGVVALGVSDNSTFALGYVVLALANGAAQAPIGSAMAGFAISGRLFDLAKLRIAIALVSAVANVAAILVGGPTAYLAANACTTLLATLLIASAASRAVAQRFGRPAPIPPDEVAGILQFTVKSSLATSVAFGTDQMLYAAAGAAGGAVFLAQLRVATAPGRFVAAAGGPVSSVLFPRVSEEAARDDHRAVRSRLERASLQLLPLAVLIAVVSYFALPKLVPLAYGSKYRAVGYASVLFVVAACARFVVAWAKVVLLAAGRPGLRLTLLAGESLILVFATVWFARTHGLVNIAYANVFVAFAVVVGWLGLLRWSRLLVAVPRAGSGASG
jgi:O-antigen/teichoic acid export membrane protein